MLRLLIAILTIDYCWAISILDICIIQVLICNSVEQSDECLVITIDSQMNYRLTILLF